MPDVDHFKAINDRFGHADGDQVLTALAACIGNNLRTGDVLGRVGGEEFLALLPDTDISAAIAIAEDMRTAVANLRLELDGEVQAITISIGAAVREPADIESHALVRRADRALYAAKHAGRNRVAISTSDRPDDTLENPC